MFFGPMLQQSPPDPFPPAGIFFSEIPLPSFSCRLAFLDPAEDCRIDYNTMAITLIVHREELPILGMASRQCPIWPPRYHPRPWSKRISWPLSDNRFAVSGCRIMAKPITPRTCHSRGEERRYSIHDDSIGIYLQKSASECPDEGILIRKCGGVET